MFAQLKQAWDFLRAERLASHPVESVFPTRSLFGTGFCEVRLYRKRDGACWVTLVARGGTARVYVPLEPDQASALARRLDEVAERAKQVPRTRTL